MTNWFDDLSLEDKKRWIESGLRLRGFSEIASEEISPEKIPARTTELISYGWTEVRSSVKLGMIAYARSSPRA